MIQEVKKTLGDELTAVTEEVGKVWFEMGRTQYEVELAQKRAGELSIKAHNLNQRALDLEKKIKKERAEAEAIAIKLAPAETPPDGATQ